MKVIYIICLVALIAFQTIFISCGQTKKAEPYNESRELVPNPEGYKKDHSVLLADTSQLEEELIIDSINRLKEVIDRGEYVKKQSKGARHLQFLVWERPTIDQPYYWIKVMEDNGSSKYTHFDFYARFRPFQLMYYDIVNDTVLDLTTWRNRKGIKGDTLISPINYDNWKLFWKTFTKATSNKDTATIVQLTNFPFLQNAYSVDKKEFVELWISQTYPLRVSDTPIVSGDFLIQANEGVNFEKIDTVYFKYKAGKHFYFGKINGYYRLIEIITPG
jgi:hypothetical protein